MPAYGLKNVEIHGKLMPPSYRLIKLTRPLPFYACDEKYYVVPQGFISNGASVPRAFWALIPPFGPYAAACVVHDWLYTELVLPRELCDRTFYELMLDCGVDRELARLMFESCRAFGERAYHDMRMLKVMEAENATYSVH